MYEKRTGNKITIEFSSLSDFYNYITTTEVNEVFKHSLQYSDVSGDSFSGTNSFAEAVELMKNGWPTMSEMLTKRLKVIENEIAPVQKQRNILSVQGYQAVVPLYLNGSPNNMIGKKSVPIKQKVITINKSIDYSGFVSKETIVEQSIKALQIVKKLESQGQRVNLNIMLGTTAGRMSIFLKIRVKNSTERLNVSKLAFPLMNPSMLRRLYFKFVEVYPEINSEYRSGYGRPSDASLLRTVFPNEHLIPSIVRKEVDQINNLKDLENI